MSQKSKLQKREILNPAQVFQILENQKKDPIIELQPDSERVVNYLHIIFNRPVPASAHNRNSAHTRGMMKREYKRKNRKKLNRSENTTCRERRQKSRIRIRNNRNARRLSKRNLPDGQIALAQVSIRAAWALSETA